MGRWRLSLTLSILITFMFGCSQIKTRRDRGQPRDGAILVPSEQDDADKAQTESPDGDGMDKTKVAVVLGPGGYKAFAHTGVLKSLIKSNIPIHKVVGFGWGSLVGGLYSQRAKINEAEWKLYKLSKVELNKSGFFSGGKGPQDMGAIQSFLETNLDNKDLSDLETPFMCPSLDLRRGSTRWVDRGKLLDAVKRCMASPPLLDAKSGQVAALFSLEDSISRLKQEGYNVIILVNVLGDGSFSKGTERIDGYAARVLWTEVRRSIWRAKALATDVVEVTTRGIRMDDYESRKLLVVAGEKAAGKTTSSLLSKYGF